MTINVISKYVNDHSFGSEYEIYIGRGSVLGNPYTHINPKSGILHAQVKMVVSSRQEAIDMFDANFDSMMCENTRFKMAIDSLVLLERNGKPVSLKCFCYPNACHGDVIKRRVEEIVRG